MAELDALSAHLIASLHFESLADGWPIVIHNYYPRGILNIVRARIRKGRKENGHGEPENGMPGGVARGLCLGLKIARNAEV